MRSSEHHPVRILRGICDLTQAELADLIGCARLTIHTLESGRLKLSAKMAEKLSLHTGISQRWLLDPEANKTPVCEHHPQRPFTPQVFKMTRAEIASPRIEPLDVIAIESFVAAVYRRLCDAAWQAYRRDKITYFYYSVREFLTELGDSWADSRKMPDTADVCRLHTRFAELMEQTRSQKAKAFRQN